MTVEKIYYIDHFILYSVNNLKITFDQPSMTLI
jgi:hypothetical protein